MEPITTHQPPADVSWLRTAIRGRTRIALAWFFVLTLIFTARELPTLPGIVICFVGATIRFWASGFLRKDATPSVGGPYGMTRNPLYLGTYLMALGTAVSISNWWLLGVTTVVFAAIYHFIILEEEIKLREIFGQPYVRYTELVPRFFPRPWPVAADRLDAVNPKREFRAFSWELAMKNKAYEAYVSFAGLIAFVAGVAWVWKNFAAV